MERVRTLIPAQTISESVRRLGAQLTRDYQGSPLTVLGILTGSIVLVTDLIRQISIPHQLGFLQASSYRGSDTRPGTLQISLDFLPDLRGRDVLLVDDIFDTGRTLAAVTEQLQVLRPNSLKTAVLLWKTTRREVDQVPDYFCFEIPDEFVVGYGLDFQQQYRHLPDLGVLEQVDEESDSEVSGSS